MAQRSPLKPLSWHVQELPPRFQPQRSGETFPARPAQGRYFFGRRYHQALAALRPPALEDGATGLGAVPLPKPVGSVPLDLRGLDKVGTRLAMENAFGSEARASCGFQGAGTKSKLRQCAVWAPRGGLSVNRRALGVSRCAASFANGKDFQKTRYKIPPPPLAVGARAATSAGARRRRRIRFCGSGSSFALRGLVHRA